MLWAVVEGRLRLILLLRAIQRRFYRQRAHANPFSDHNVI